MPKASARGARPLRRRALERSNVDYRGNPVERKRQPLTPVRMLVDGTGNIGLVDDAQHILQRYRQQAGSGPRQKTGNRIEIMAVDAVMNQHVAQHHQGVPSLIVAFTGVDSERAFQPQVAEGTPAGIARQVVGVEGWFLYTSDA